MLTRCFDVIAHKIQHAWYIVFFVCYPGFNTLDSCVIKSSHIFACCYKKLNEKVIKEKIS